MSQVLAPTNDFRAQFDERRAEILAVSPAWLATMRDAAMARFGELGMPTNALEDYRNTPLEMLTDGSYRVAPVAGVSQRDLAEFTFGSFKCHQLVFVNGVFHPELSAIGALPKGVTVAPMSVALSRDGALAQQHLGKHVKVENHALAALNTALFADGGFIHIARGIEHAEPIHLLFLTEPNGDRIATFPRTLIVLDEGAHASVVESYAGLGDTAYLTNAVTEIHAADNTTLDHYKMQRENGAAFHNHAMSAWHGRAVQLRSHAIAFGAAVARNDVHGYLGGEGINCVLNGMYVLRGKQHCDTSMLVEHAAAHCDSHELYKAVLQDHSHGGFRGRIHVHPGAQKTDAKQTSQTLLLSPDARMNTKPQLEIYADDVKCTHGATIGQLDANAMFYLRSRGLDFDAARALLVRAFAGDITERIQIAPLRARVVELLAGLLPGA